MRNRFFAEGNLAFILAIATTLISGSFLVGCQRPESTDTNVKSPTPVLADSMMLPESGRTITVPPTSTATPSGTAPPSTVFPSSFQPSPTSRLYSLHSLTNPLDRITFVSSRSGNYEVYIASVGRGHRRYQLTIDPAEDNHPDLSPDGKTVAFVSDRSGDLEIYLIDVETEARTRLTYHPAEDTHPSWSPDGSTIAFHSKRDGNNEIYLINVDCANRSGGCPEEVLRLTNNVFDDIVPAWSHDGQRIAFMSAREGNLEIYHMKPDGTDIIRLTHNPGVDGFPTWSPDGTMLAFHSEQDGNTDIYAMSLDGKHEWRLTNNAGDDLAPDWHGDHIVYMGLTYGNFKIYMISAPGADQQLKPEIIWSASSPFFDGFPSWGRLGGSALETPRITAAPTPQPIDIPDLPSEIPVPGNDSFLDFAWSPDGSLLVAGGYHGIYFYDASTMTLNDMVKLDLDQAVNSLDFNPDGTILAVGHRDHLVRLWDPDTKKVMAILEGHDSEVSQVFYSPDGETIASAGQGGDLLLWDLEHSLPIHTLYKDKYRPLQAIAFSPDGSLLAYGNNKWGDLYRFDRNAGTFLKSLRTYDIDSGSAVVAFSPNSHLVAAGGGFNYRGAGNVQVWDASSGERITSLIGHENGVVGLDFTPSGNILVSMSGEGQIHLWDTQTWESLGDFFGANMGRVHEFAFAPGGRWLAAVSYKHVYFWDIQEAFDRIGDQGLASVNTLYSSNAEMLPPLEAQPVDLPAEIIYVSDVDWSPTALDLALVTIGIHNPVNEIYIVDLNCLDDVDEAATILPPQCGSEVKPIGGSEGLNYDLVWSPDGHSIAFGNARGDIYIVPKEGGELHGWLPKPNPFSDNTGWAWSPDGTRIAFVSQDNAQGGTDSDLYTVELGTETLTRLELPSSDESEPAWSPKGDSIAFVSDLHGSSDIFLLVGEGPPQRLTLDDERDEVNPLWSPDSRTLTYLSLPYGKGHEGYLMLLDLESGTTQRLSDQLTELDSIAWSPSGDRIVFASRDQIGTLDLFLARLDGTAIRHLSAMQGSEGNPIWSTDGKWIAFLWGESDYPVGDLYVVKLESSPD